MKHAQLQSHRVSNLSEYFFARANQKITELIRSGKNVINLGIGSPDLPPHPAVIAELKRALDLPNAHAYPPYNGLEILRAKIAQWYLAHHQVTLDPRTQVFPTAGSKQGIAHLTMAVVDQGDQVLIPDPAYSSYDKATTIAGGENVKYRLNAANGFLPNINELEQLDLTRVKLMWINYPNNPTAAVAKKSDLVQLVQFARKHHIILANDNPYSSVTFNDVEAPSLLEVANPDDLVIELNSMSKTYNMAGWRIGWLVGHPELIRVLGVINSNIETGSFIPLQHAAALALDLPQEWITQRNQIYAQRRDVLIKLMEALGCTVTIPKATLYVWAKLPAQIQNSEVFSFNLLEETGVFITPGTAFGDGGEGYLRAALCQPIEVIEEALERVLAWKRAQ